MKVHAVAALLLAALSAFLVWEARGDARCEADEPAWVSSSFRTFELARAVAGPRRWETAYDEWRLGDWGNKNPPVGKLIVGAALAAARRAGDTMRYRWDWYLTPDQNLARGTLPPFHLLVAGRTAVALCGAAALGLAYLLAVQLLGARWEALLAPVLLYSAPTFVDHATHVDMDPPQIALLLGSAVAFCAFLRRGGKAAFVSSLLVAGLSCATKLSSGPMVPLLAAGVLLRRPRESVRRGLQSTAWALVLPGLTFVAVNPYLHPAPVARSLGLVHAWSATKAQQREDPLLARGVVHGRGEAFGQVMVQGLLWPNRVAEPAGAGGALSRVATYGLLVALGALLVTARRRLPDDAARRRWALRVSAALGAALLVLAATGAPSLVSFLLGLGIGEVIDRARQAADAPRAVARFLLLATALFYLATALWLPFNWSRYYLPVMIWMPAFAAAGLTALLELMRPLLPRAAATSAPATAT